MLRALSFVEYKIGEVSDMGFSPMLLEFKAMVMWRMISSICTHPRLPHFPRTSKYSVSPPYAPPWHMQYPELR